MPLHLALIPFFVLPSLIQLAPPPSCQESKFLRLLEGNIKSGMYVCGGRDSGIGWNFDFGHKLRNLKYFRLLWESEPEHRFFVGSSAGLISQWYLGRGVDFSFTCALPRLESTAAIIGYPIEGVNFSLGLDLLKGYLQFSWEVEKPENLLGLAELAAFAYYLTTQAQHKAFD
jgi:hypothetical protein